MAEDRGECGIRSQQFVPKVANRPENAVSRHSRSVGIVIFGANVDVVAQKLHQEFDRGLVSSFDFGIRENALTAFDEHTEYPEGDNRHNDFCLRVFQHPVDLAATE